MQASEATMKAYTTQQVADRLGVSRPSVYLWIQAKMFPNAFRKSPQPNSPWMVPEEDLIEFEKRRHHPVSATP